MGSKRLAWAWGVVVCVLLAHNIDLLMSGRLAPDTDILALLPVQERDPVLHKATTQIVGSTQQRLVVLVGADDWQQASRAADAYLDVIRPHAKLLMLDKRTNQWQDDGLWFRRHRSILLTAGDELALKSQPENYWIDAALGKLHSPIWGIRPSPWQEDPFGLFASWMQARASETPVRPREGRLFVGDGRRRYVVMPFLLGVPAFSMSAQQAIMPLLERARTAARSATPQAEVLAAGVVLYAAAAGAQAQWEVSVIGIGSILGITLLIWLTFHSIKPIAWILLSVAVGCLGALSLCWLLFERIHLLTLVFGASLIGGAQDYGSYFLCNRLATAGQNVDSGRLLRRLLPALALALTTTVVGYLALALTPFPGLRQVAVFSSLGLIFAWLTVICWFPALMRREVTRSGPAVKWFTVKLPQWPSRHYRPIPWMVGFAVVGIFGFSRLGVQDDIRTLQNPPQSLMDSQLKLNRLLAVPAPAQFYLVRGSSAEDLMQREEALKQRLDSLVEKEIIVGYHAVSNWVPSFRTQAARRELIEKTLLGEDGALAPLARRIGADERWVGSTRDRLRESALPLTPEGFLESSAGASVRHLWIGPVAGGFASVVALRGVGAASLPLLQRAAGGIDGVQWVDTVGEISAILGRYRRTMSWVIVLSYCAVYLLLYSRYGRAAWRVLAPVALASVATLALLGVAGQGLQLFHVLALMLLLGIGVDYGIFFQDHPDGSDPVAWLAVSLSALSTMLSFGLLSLSTTPALHTFGLTMLIGTTAVCLIVPWFRPGNRQIADRAGVVAS